MPDYKNLNAEYMCDVCHKSIHAKVSILCGGRLTPISNIRKIYLREYRDLLSINTISSSDKIFVCDSCREKLDNALNKEVEKIRNE